MTEFNSKQVRIETASALERVRQSGSEQRYAAYVGLDVHKETIAIAVAWPGRDESEYWGEIKHSGKAVEKLIGRLSEACGGALLLFCYEAGPCGYGLHRQIVACGHVVVQI